jgi:hypothetical protein
MKRPMPAKLPMRLVFVAALGCSAQTPPSRQATTVFHPEQPASNVGASPLADPGQTLAEADRAYDSQLSASRGQFDVERQVAVLKEAVLLYGQFLERVDGRPELEPAVRKSRERIADATATIIFLEASLKGEPPAARNQ